tara:strand:+ start:12678 stop:13610 length:933 start_codon:yes stop_codon:yes gene_type:complete
VIKNILLLGASGFVGTNFLKDPRNNNYKIFSPNRQKLDLKKIDDLYGYLDKNRPDLIINAAGKVGGILSNSNNNYDYLNENILINYNVINVSKELKIPNFINLSSSCIYPVNFTVPFSEDNILSAKLEPTNEGYALSKIYALKSCEFISKGSKLNYKSIIPCNLYGPHDDFNSETSHMIPGAIVKIHNSKKANNDSVTIWGTGKVRREFMFIKDFIDFLYFSIERFDKIPNILNVGLGFDHTIKEYYETIMNVIKYEGELVYDSLKPDGIKSKLMNISKLEKLNWKAKTNLSKGIELTYKYYINNYANQL